LNRLQYRLLGVACCFLSFGPALWAQSLQVVDAAGHTTNVTTAQIASAPHVISNVKDHDTPATFDGVPLAALLTTAGVQLGDKLRGQRLTEVLLVEAADGYKVAFALAEVDPAFATREIILADKRDGKPLDAKEGPLRIVAPGDKRAARWVRQVTVLRILAVK
jgi:Oxidoreductase molybdopterin binding domain